VHLYAAQAPKALADLQTAMASGDAAAASRAAHSLKSMSANIGAARMKGIAGDIERSARDRSGADRAEIATDLSALLVRTLDALHTRLELTNGITEDTRRSA
jgi:HPt (histidine-containing phosphotransfer) domain-containing protein